MKPLLICFLILILSACDSGELWREGNYVVPWIDNGTYLSYGKPDGAFYGLVDSRVISIGHNKNYLVAQRLDTKSDNIYYYIINRHIQDTNGKNGNKFSQYIAVTGPLSETQFLSMKKELNLPEFTEIF